MRRTGAGPCQNDDWVPAKGSRPGRSSPFGDLGRPAGSGPDERAAGRPVRRRILGQGGQTGQLPSSSSSSPPPMFEASCATVTAPDSTTSTQGSARAAAIATASGGASTAERCGRPIAPGVASRPLARASLTMTPRPASCASARAGPADGSRTFQVACTPPNSGTPVESDVQGAPERRRLAGAADRQPDDQTVVARRPPAAPARPASSRTPLSSVAEWIWYRPKPRPAAAPGSRPAVAPGPRASGP